ncbi:SRPBCC family protein [Nocardia tengchongensis]|uniref:SRPBCC family protein n=1 Tax=Nocardia tengchongensis TaxID=2055889 RepID=UPI0036B6C964
MATIRQEVVIEAAPEYVWDVVRDVGAVHERLLPGRVVGTRVEAGERFLTFPDGHVIRELIVAVDDESRRMAYSVVEGGPARVGVSPRIVRGSRRRRARTADLDHRCSA